MALILLAASAVAAPFMTRQFGFMGFVAVYGVAAGGWLVARGAVVPFRVAVGIALALRLLVAFHDPVLSGDVYRYMWDGRVLASGMDPYRYAPNDPRLSNLREEWHGRINHPEIRSIYPPHAEVLFVIARSIALWRVLTIACDLAVLWLLRRRRDLLVGWATFPPLIFEAAWNGHVEIVAALLLLIAYLFDSGAAAGLAAGVKLIPIAAIPSLIVRSSRRSRFAATCAAALAIPAIPFVLAGPLMPGMRDYGRRWIFNSPLFEIVLNAMDRARIAESLKDIWTAVKDPMHLEGISRFIYEHLYSDLLTRAVLAVAAVTAITILAACRSNVSSSLGALLICAPAIHPWYWLVLIPLAMMERAESWLLIALCAPLSYLLYTGVSKWIVMLLCYALPLVIARLRLSVSGTSGAAAPSAATPVRTARDTSQS